MLSNRLRRGGNNAALRTIDQLERALAELPRHDRRSEDNDRASAQTVLKAVANVPCAILIANNSGRFVTVNDAAVALTGYARGELLRMSVWDLTPPPGLSEGRTLWRKFLEQERMRGTYEIRRKDGSSARTEYVALANVVPGLHLSALIHAGKETAAHRVKPKKTA